MNADSIEDRAVRTLREAYWRSQRRVRELERQVMGLPPLSSAYVAALVDVIVEAVDVTEGRSSVRRLRERIEVAWRLRDDED